MGQNPAEFAMISSIRLASYRVHHQDTKRRFLRVPLCLGALVVGYETAGGVNEERISYER